MPMLQSTFANRIFFSGLLLVLACGFSIISCAPLKKLPPGKKGISRKAEKFSISRLKKEAREAWQEEDYFRAQKFYQKLLDRKLFSPKERSKFLSRVSYSAIKNNNFSLAKNYLKKWENIKPEIRNTWRWHKTLGLFKKLKQGEQVYRNYLRDLVLFAEVPWSVKFQGLKALSRHYLQKGNYKSLWRVQRKAYLQAPKKKAKLEMERQLIDFLAGQKLNWQRIRETIPQGKMLQYPYAFLTWFSKLRRLEKDRLDWATARKQLGLILNNSEICSKSYLKSRLKDLQEKYKIPSLQIALLLPLDGAYEELGWKILKGVDVANWQYTCTEMDIQLAVINTSNSNWKEELSDLPAEYKFIGGPLRKGIWRKIHQDKLYRERVFFTFLSDLTPGTEGKSGYRFFPGLRDQVRPLVGFLKKQLDVEKFAILYPRSSYGRKRARIFREEIADFDASLAGLAGYPPQKQSGLRKVVADLLKIPKGYNIEDLAQKKSQKSKSRPKPDFRAVFLPDNFTQARLLIPEFFYFGEDRLVFLGPTLWSQELKHIDKIAYRYFRLAIMSGGWNPCRSNSAVKSLREALKKTAQGRADFWVSLGYDFLRFIHLIKLRYSDWPPANLNQKLSAIDDFTWSMAPIQWNAQGEAKQNLFLLKPQNAKAVPVKKDRFKYLFKKAWEKH